MKKLNSFKNSRIKVLFTDIDDTLTDEGKLEPEAYSALWMLKKNGLKIVPITGRPAGWCEMIARFWPVDGVIGENGAFYFRYFKKKMTRHFALEETERLKFRKILDGELKDTILRSVPGAAISTDQFCRLTDLAIDFREDVPPLKETDVEKIVEIFRRFGAHAKVSSIHVNGWFGDYDKLTMCKTFALKELNLDLSKPSALEKVAFVGDSPNDEPIFEYFPNSFAVANISKFVKSLKSPPQYVAPSRGGKGFSEIARRLLFVT